MEFTMASRTPKSDTTTASPAASITPEALKALFDNMAELKATVARYQAEATAALAKPAATGKSEVSTLNDAKVLKVFKKAGFKDVRPRETVLTFNKWVEQGRRPIEGSKSLACNNLRLFHLSQTRPLTKDDTAKMKDQKAAHEARKSAKVTQLHPGAQQ
jgi:hypothetical protein